MKLCYNICFFAILFLISSLCSIEYDELESSEFDLNIDGKFEKLTIYSDDYWSSTFEPDTVFVKIKMLNANSDSVIVIDEDGFIKINNSTIKNNNIGSSEFISICKISTENFAFIVQGWQYASSASKIAILGVNREILPIILFNSNLNITNITDLNNDGTNELVGYKWYRQPISKNEIMQQYQPYFVYSINHETVKYEFNEELTIQYNLENDDIWAGEDRDYNIVEIHPTNSKPYIMNIEEAKRKFSDEN